MKKVISYLMIGICCFMLCGCTKYPNMKQEDYDLVAEYAAGLLLKYSETSDNRLMNIDEANDISDEGFTPIFVVSEFLRSEDPFECSWDVTSDSIAAYVSHCLNAKLLIVTNVNGIYTQEPKEPGSTFLSKIDATTLLTFQESSIDVMLPSLLLRYGTNCYVVNGKYPERVMSLIDDNINDYNFDYTKIIGE